MFSSEAISRDMSRFLASNPSGEGEFAKGRDFMGSDLFLNPAQGSGLARYRSAPSSFLSALLDSTADNSSSGYESEALFSALMDGPPRDLSQKQYRLKEEVGVEPEPEPEPEPRPGAVSMGNESAVVGSYSVAMENQVNPRMRNSSNLVRQSSSPAGFFNGYGVMGEVGNYRVQNQSRPNNSSSSMNFSSVASSSSRFMPSIPENINESIAAQNQQLGSSSASNAREFEASVFPQDSWNEPPFNSLKRNRDGDAKMFSNFNGLENQNGETRKNGLVHHLSLPSPKTSEMAEIENFLQFQPDTVHCQIRAKRGCATHPRSIAERVRRTRISEKMKKLQDLFPTMDKQTSTADMLDLAVEYIKDLQTQVKTLADTKAKCVCPGKRQQTSPTT